MSKIKSIFNFQRQLVTLVYQRENRVSSDACSPDLRSLKRQDFSTEAALETHIALSPFDEFANLF